MYTFYVGLCKQTKADGFERLQCGSSGIFTECSPDSRTATSCSYAGSDHPQISVQRTQPRYCDSQCAIVEIEPQRRQSKQVECLCFPFPIAGKNLASCYIFDNNDYLMVQSAKNLELSYGQSAEKYLNKYFIYISKYYAAFLNPSNSLGLKLPRKAHWRKATYSIIPFFFKKGIIWVSLLVGVCRRSVRTMGR